MTTPTASSMKMRFPELQDSDDASIEFALEEARLYVDDTWLTKFQMLAVMYLAAHFVSVSMRAADLLGGDDVQSYTLGRLSETYKQSAGGGTPQVPDDDLDSTPYGKRFKDMRRRSFPGVLVV